VRRNKAKKEEQQRQEWWERRDPYSQEKGERDKVYLMNQIRRNEALRSSKI